MRFASPNEQRTISREYCGFYNALVIGAVYEFSGSGIDLTSSRFFYGALKRCIDKYPTLGVVVRDMHTDKAYFERVPTINIEDHISIVEETDGNGLASTEGNDDDMKKIENVLPSIMDRPWPASPSPWRVVVLPLSSSNVQTSGHQRCFIAFSYSHALGDGITALAFHRTFRDGIFDRACDDCSALVTTVASFPAPFDTAETLSISWGFLLRPLIAVLLPSFIAEALGLRATASSVNSDTWTGTRMFFEPETFRTCLRLIEIPGSDVETILRMARKKGARLTGTLHQCIVRALSKVLPLGEATQFVSGTAVNMRPAVSKSNDEMGLFVNALYEVHGREDALTPPLSDDAWASARSLTERLAECAVTLHDQPLGLLRYVPSIRKWTAAKVGKERDSSYELSNLGAFEEAFESEDLAGEGQCKIVKMVFSRPANVTCAPIAFSVVSVKGGSMVISLGWQPGAIGVPVEAESAFVDELATFLKEDLKNLS